MTEPEVRETLRRLAAEKEAELQQRRQLLTPEQKTERRALMIASNIAGHCAAFPDYMFNGHFLQVAQRRVFEEFPQYFGTLRAQYNALPEEEQRAFLRYAFSVVMVRGVFLDPREKQLACLDPQTAPERVFEARIIAGVCASVLDAWSGWYASAGGPLYA